jgi:hypothetical protein
MLTKLAQLLRPKDKDVEVFITVHDEDLLLRCEESKQFASLSRYRYVFVGHRPVGKLSTLKEKVIVARECQYNIEQYPHLYDFTAWYCLVNNRLITQYHVVSLQYDMTLQTENFQEQVLAKLLEDSNQILGFLPVSTSLYFSSHREIPLAETLRKKNVDWDTLFAHDTTKLWPTGNAVAMRTSTLRQLLQWLLEWLPEFVENPYAGHVAERLIKVYSLLSGIQDTYLPQMLHHTMRDSHGTTRILART